MLCGGICARSGGAAVRIEFAEDSSKNGRLLRLLLVLGGQFATMIAQSAKN